MTQKAPREPWGGTRWLIASLAILLAVVIYSDSLHPVVKAFGLAHTRLLHLESGPVLVVDHLPSAEASSVQTVFAGEIWGRHAFRVGEFLVPFLTLLIAMSGVCYLLLSHSSRPGFRFFHLSRGCVPPPVAMWLCLFLGGCLAAGTLQAPQLDPSLALIPLVITLLVSAVVAVAPSPSAKALSRAFTATTASRWFWLGYLMLAPAGFFRHERLLDGAQLSSLSPSTLLLCVLALASLHWATRDVTVDLRRFDGDSGALGAQVERLTLLAIQELWLLFPLVVMASAVSSLQGERLVPYLASSVVCALMFRWSVRRRERKPSSAEATVRFMAALITVGLVVCLPFAGQLQPHVSDFSFTLAAWLALIALGWVRARTGTWSPLDASDGALTVVESQAARRAFGGFGWRQALLAMVTLVVLSVALRGGFAATVAGDPALAAAQTELHRSVGHQARLLRLEGHALLVGCNLDMGALSLAAEVVSNHLPDTDTRVVSVRTRRWERAARIALALTVSLFLVLPTYLLTFAPAGRSRAYIGFCSLLGGVNGAFAIGSALGWFWLDPAPHLAAFGLSAGLGWFGLGYARGWLDSRVTTPEPAASGGLVATREV